MKNRDYLRRILRLLVIRMMTPPRPNSFLLDLRYRRDLRISKEIGLFKIICMKISNKGKLRKSKRFKKYHNNK